MHIYGNVNFKEFVKLLSAFSSRAARDTKLEYMFMVYDVDGDGKFEGRCLNKQLPSCLRWRNLSKRILACIDLCGPAFKL